MPKLTSIKRCHVCGSISLIPFYKVPISDLMTDEDIYRDVLFCTECETAHYINDYGRIEYEFSIKTNSAIERIIKKDIVHDKE